MVPSNSDRLTSKEIAFARIINLPVVDLRELQILSWHGIPKRYRAKCWKLLLGYLPAEACWRNSYVAEKRREYYKAVKEHFTSRQRARNVDDAGTFRQVRLDVPRTAPSLRLFNDKRVQTCLEQILCIWAVRNSGLSYVQGINDLVTPLFSVFLGEHYEGSVAEIENGEGLKKISDRILKEVEADTYFCLTLFLSNISENFETNLPGLTRMVARLEKKIQLIDIDLYNHLKQSGVEFLWFSLKWMNCLLLRELSLQCVIRIWDTYLSEENLKFEELHVYVCAGLLHEFSSALRKMEYDELFEFIQRLPTFEWGDDEIEILLSQASSWRYMHQAKEKDLEEDECIIGNKQSTSQINEVIYDTDTLLFL